MGLPLFRRHFVFKAFIAGALAFSATALNAGSTLAQEPEPIEAEDTEYTATSTISDDEIGGFLFRINEETKAKVLGLDGEPAKILPVPILFGVKLGDFSDTWGEARAGGRVHNASDIIAPRGALVVSPTKAVVTKVGRDNKGGNYVITANPGGEQYYYAHLDARLEQIAVGDILETGDVIGYVGNTGNARGRSPHLHFAIYYTGLARNPFPRLAKEFSADEKTAALERIFNNSIARPGANGAAVRFVQRFLIDAGSGEQAKKLNATGATGYFGTLTKKALSEYQQSVGITPAIGHFGPVTRASVLSSIAPDNEIYRQIAGAKTEAVPDSNNNPNSVTPTRDLELGSTGENVRWLQNFLMDQSPGKESMKLAQIGATGYFGAITKKALAEYQQSVGIHPAAGYFGPKTRTYIQNTN